MSFDNDAMAEGSIPPDFVLICDGDDGCGSEEPAPLDASPGDCFDCAYCGEIAHVEIA
jgi:hypothetical protein